MEEEIPTRLGTLLVDHAESCGGESRGRRKQERFEARDLPLTLSQSLSCFACQGNTVLNSARKSRASQPSRPIAGTTASTLCSWSWWG